MPKITSHHTFDAQIEFQTPVKDNLLSHVTEVKAASVNGIFEGVTISFTIAAEDYHYIMNPHHLFNSTLERRRHNPPLKQDTRVEIKAALTSELLGKLDPHGDRASDVADTIRNAQAKSELLYTENWYALEVKQEVPFPPEIGEGVLKEGYRLDQNIDNIL